MKNRLAVVCATGILAAMATVVIAANAKAAHGSSSGTPVTTYVADLDGNGTAYYIQSDGQAGPVRGATGEYDNNYQNVVSFLNANTYNGLPPGDWWLDLLSSSSRTMRLTFSGNGIPAGALGSNPAPNPPFTGTQYVVSKFQEDCTAVNQDIALMTYVGQTFTCPAIFRFNQVGTSNYWRLYMYGSWGSAAPETSWVQIQCNQVGSNGYCNDWYVDPIPVQNPDGTTSRQAVARLEYAYSRKGASGSTNLGDFYLTFHVHVTQP